MKKYSKPRRLFIIACICLLTFSLVQIGLRVKDYVTEASSSKQIEDMFGIPDASDAQKPTVAAQTNVSEGDGQDAEDPYVYIYTPDTISVYQIYAASPIYRRNNHKGESL